MDRVGLWSVSQSNNLDENGVAHANSSNPNAAPIPNPTPVPNATPIPNPTRNLNPNAKPDASSNARPDRQKEVKERLFFVL